MAIGQLVGGLILSITAVKALLDATQAWQTLIGACLAFGAGGMVHEGADLLRGGDRASRRNL